MERFALRAAILYECQNHLGGGGGPGGLGGSEKNRNTSRKNWLSWPTVGLGRLFFTITPVGCSALNYEGLVASWAGHIQGLCMTCVLLIARISNVEIVMYVIYKERWQILSSVKEFRGS